jgi:meso-butanediol dehydrogenase / (S,S)-butanediol dehydrogenase / diacetyl reductase
MKRLEGKAVVVTGAAQGIGRATAERLATEGARLFLADREGPEVRAVAAQIGERGTVASGAEFDLSDRDAPGELVERAVAELGGIDILINNAGILEVNGLFDVRADEWDRVLGVNTLGMFGCLQAAAQQMIRRGSGGSVVNVASVIGRVGHPYLITYGASKAAIINITRSAAAALASDGIRVNAVCPGIIGTAMWDTADARYAEIEHLPLGEPRRRRTEKVPLRREGEPQDVAAVIAFLASEDAAYVTGQAINVCGGTHFA